MAVALLTTAAACGGDDDTSTEGGRETEETIAGASDLLGAENLATGEPVVVGMISDGASASFDNSDELRAGQAAAEYFNTHQGGIGGRPIELKTCETTGTPEGGTDCANQMIEAGVVAVTLSQSAVTGLVWETLHAAGVPTWFTQANGEEIETDPTSSFMVFNPTATLLGPPIAASKAASNNKVAFVVIDVPQAVEILETNEELLLEAGLDYEIVRVPVGTADMTTQMQSVQASGAQVVQVIGNDAFCIAAFQGLRAVSFAGTITTITQCITDATREALPGGLDGIQIFSTLAVGAVDDPTYQLYQAIITEYGGAVKDADNFIAVGGYAAVSSFATAAAGVDGADITRTSIVEAIRAMPASAYPGGGGVQFQCNGKVKAGSPAVCTNQWLQASLDSEGNAVSYTVEDGGDLFTG